MSRHDMASSDPAVFGDLVSAKVVRKLLPFIFLLYFVNQIDRVNVAFAALTMNKDLGLTPEMYGFAAGIFFIGYFLFEIPSNLIMHRVGARLWMLRIMLTWGVVSMATAFVRGPTEFYVARVLLGLAEAGFVPGIFLYLAAWVPERRLGRATAWFILAGPLTTVLAGPLSTLLLELDGMGGLRGWQWMFVIEGLPAVVLAFAILRWLPNTSRDAAWLQPAERTWLEAQITAEDAAAKARGGHSLLYGLTSPPVLLLSLIYVALVIGLYGIGFWLPQIVRGMGFGTVQTGLIVAIPYALATVACVFWSRRTDRSLERRWHFALPAFLGSAGLMISALAGGGWLTLIPISLAVVGIWAALPVFWCIPGRYLAGVASAAGLATINSVGNLGGFAGPYLVGWLRGAGGSFTMPLILLAIGPLLAGLLVLCLPARIPTVPVAAPA